MKKRQKWLGWCALIGMYLALSGQVGAQPVDVSTTDIKISQKGLNFSQNNSLLNVWIDQAEQYEMGARKEAVQRIRAAYENQAVSLDLSGLKITSLPPELEALSELKNLNLSNTLIDGFPSFLTGLKNLEWLNLSDTPISIIPESLGNMSNLQVLNLSKTNIKTLPNSIGNLINLKKLNISKTQIVETELPETIICLNLEEMIWPDGERTVPNL
ncbi:MAG: Leucine rich repeat-containing protein [Glomeribacter sp. 1016415]|nr:Leucine rich repeat-containing protein [Glomeribacter sp. 1016415]